MGRGIIQRNHCSQYFVKPGPLCDPWFTCKRLNTSARGLMTFLVVVSVQRQWDQRITN